MKKIIAFILYHKIHFFSWIVFMLSESVIIGLATGIFGDVLSYVVHYSQNILLFYFCSLWLYPKIFRNGITWVWKLPFFTAVVYSIYLSVNYGVDNYLLKETTWYGVHEISISKPYIFTQLWRALFFMGFAGFYFLFRTYVVEIETRKKAEKEHYQSLLIERDLALQLENARNSYLKAQINPHLLFNTLSFVYEDIFQSSPKTAEAVMELCDVMRYSVNCELREPLLELNEEIEQVERLVKLHSMRFDEEIFLEFTYTKDVKTVKFIPLVLLTLAENIFKHGVFQDQQYPASLSVNVINEHIIITSKNWPNRSNRKDSTNKGLANIRQRLEFTYGNLASIDLKTSDGYFVVEIVAPIELTKKQITE